MTSEPTEWDEQQEDDDSIVLINDEGEEMPLQILASREDESGMYVLAAEDDDEGEAALFKCIPNGEDEVIFELVDGDHEDYDRAFNLFKDDYEALGIDVEEIEIE